MNRIHSMDIKKNIDLAKRYTRVYKQHMDSHIAIREAMCLREQYPALCREVRDYDLIAGRVYHDMLVGFGLEVSGNKLDILRQDNKADDLLTDEEREIRSRIFRSSCGHTYHYTRLKELLEDEAVSDSEKLEIKEILDFWYDESMIYKYLKSLPTEIKKNLGRSAGASQYTSTFFRVCCISADYDKLIRLGIPGMKALLEEKRQRALVSGQDTGLYEGMLIALDVLIEVCRYYEKQCREMAFKEAGKKRGKELIRMADCLSNIACKKPETFREAVQLFWLYYLLTDTRNFGRMDVYLGDLYVKDIESGIETEESIKSVLKSLWKIISEQRNEGGDNYPFNTRIILGGKGRRNPDNADKFALTAMEVTREMKTCEPMVTLRLYKGQNHVLFDKALECIKEGCIHPILYNDDVHIPWIAKAYNITLEEAEGYIPEGCGEIRIDHKSVGSPNNIINYITALDLVLHNGYSTEVKEQRGLKLGELKDFDTFDKLVQAFLQQVDFTNEIFARRHALENKIEAENAAFLFLSMLTDDCIERNKSIFDNGARYIGGIIETFGLTNVADSLYCIKKLVYDRKVMTLEKLVEILDRNFAGYEKERQMMLALPKYGNDIDEVDDLHTELVNHVNRNAAEKASKYGFHFFLNCNLNQGGITYALNTKASADGRVFGEPMAIGNGPTAGRDKNGITAVLNSMAKGEKLHAGNVHNLKVSSGILAPDKIHLFKALLNTYFDNGGCQLMITALNREDLENALIEPEKYTHIMVRVGGWTARFVELSKVHQTEILNRTMYC